MTPSDGSLPEISWFAAQIRPQRERVVSDQLTRLRVENFLPTEGGLQPSRRRPLLFPGYLFIRSARVDAPMIYEYTRDLGLYQFLGYRGLGPSAIPDEEIDSLRITAEKGKPEPCPFLAIGERVRIEHGPLAGAVGIIQRYRNLLRVVVGIVALGRSVASEVDAEDLQPYTESAPRQTPTYRDHLVYAGAYSRL